MTALAAAALLALSPRLEPEGGPERVAQSPAAQRAPAPPEAGPPPAAPRAGAQANASPETVAADQEGPQTPSDKARGVARSPEPQAAPPIVSDRPQRSSPGVGLEPKDLPADELGDAVATADDWPAPPFEDLRVGAPKSASPALRAVQLVLVGQPGYSVGEGVDLVVVASHDTPLTVCVDGPERGTIWRGAVPAGRTALTRGGRQQAFAFVAPGTYRFSVSPTGQPRCTEPIHVVEVEVGR